MHNAFKQELRRPRRVETAAGKASRLGRRKAAANPVPIALVPPQRQPSKFHPGVYWHFFSALT
jgi:hypothetical protein